MRRACVCVCVRACWICSWSVHCKKTILLFYTYGRYMVLIPVSPVWSESISFYLSVEISKFYFPKLIEYRKLWLDTVLAWTWTTLIGQKRTISDIRPEMLQCVFYVSVKDVVFTAASWHAVRCMTTKHRPFFHSLCFWQSCVCLLRRFADLFREFGVFS